MKKLVFGIIAAAMMVLGLSAAPAQAGPYTGTVGTNVFITGKTPVQQGSSAVLDVVVLPKSGSVNIQSGKLQMVCRTKTQRTGLVIRFGGKQAYDGGEARVLGPTLPIKGRWNCYVRYLGGASVFAYSTSNVTRVRVL